MAVMDYVTQRQVWLDAGRPVRGHLCAGLRKLQAYSTYGCIPDISEDGEIRGCDATNEIAILFCPMCGVELQGGNCG
jgi:hypothetical protein